MTRLQRRITLAMFPRAWRDRYGTELLDLADETGWTPRVWLDVIGCAVRVRARHHAVGLVALVGLAALVVTETAAVRGGVTDNIVWWPRSVGSAVVLVVVLVSLAAACRPPARWIGRRLRRLVR